MNNFLNLKKYISRKKKKLEEIEQNLAKEDDLARAESLGSNEERSEEDGEERDASEVKEKVRGRGANANHRKHQQLVQKNKRLHCKTLKYVTENDLLGKQVEALKLQVMAMKAQRDEVMEEVKQAKELERQQAQKIQELSNQLDRIRMDSAGPERGSETMNLLNHEDPTGSAEDDQSLAENAERAAGACEDQAHEQQASSADEEPSPAELVPEDAGQTEPSRPLVAKSCALMPMSISRVWIPAALTAVAAAAAVYQYGGK